MVRLVSQLVNHVCGSTLNYSLCFHIFLELDWEQQPNKSIMKLGLEVILTLFFFSYLIFNHSGIVLVFSATEHYWEIILRQLPVMVPKLFPVLLFLN